MYIMHSSGIRNAIRCDRMRNVPIMIMIMVMVMVMIMVLILSLSLSLIRKPLRRTRPSGIPSRDTPPHRQEANALKPREQTGVPGTHSRQKEHCKAGRTQERPQAATQSADHPAESTASAQDDRPPAGTLQACGAECGRGEPVREERDALSDPLLHSKKACRVGGRPCAKMQK